MSMNTTSIQLLGEENIFTPVPLITNLPKYDSIREKLSKENNENRDVCAKCGGECCKHFGCELDILDFTRRFGMVTEENLKKALDSGDIAIDWWSGDIRDDKPYLMKDPNEKYISLSRCYYLRTRHVGEDAVEASWGGCCVALTPTGCKFSFEDRPRGGREMPVGELNDSHGYGCSHPKDFDYKSVYAKPTAAYEWLPYHDLLEKIVYSGEYGFGY